MMKRANDIAQPASADEIDSPRVRRERPKLLFFQSRYGPDVPRFLLLHKSEHVKCLAAFFDVTVVDQDSDYAQACDRCEPDLVMFESGLQLRNVRRPVITNTNAHPGVPKVAFLNADVWGETRAGILADIERWDVEALFSNCVTAAEHLPGLARRLFVWPNFIDPELFHDYGEPKRIPVMLTGCQDPQYPWRHAVFAALSCVYPVLACPHGGYRSERHAERMLVGTDYARALNAAWFVPTCGTVARDVLRKHFEIPGSRACLITEPSVGLAAAGFVDMENCVLADETTVVDKVAHLLENVERLRAITDAGYALVQSRHTLERRDQVWQWLQLRRQLHADEHVVQPDPFGPLARVETASRGGIAHAASSAPHLVALRRGDALLCQGDYVAAQAEYERCAGYTSGMSEASLGMARCHLHLGNPTAALGCLVPPIKRTLVAYGADEPDPVEWAYLIVCLLCRGRVREARKRAEQFPTLAHPELDRCRMAVKLLAGAGGPWRAHSAAGRERASLHRLPTSPDDQWIADLGVMLVACGQGALADRLRRRTEARVSMPSATPLLGRVRDMPRAACDALYALRLAAVRKPSLSGLDHPLVVERMREKAWATLRRGAQRLGRGVSLVLQSR
jgi:hypothetical protein